MLGHRTPPLRKMSQGNNPWSNTEQWTGTGLSPEGEGVVSHKGLALSDEEGAVGSPCLDAIFRQQPLRDVPPVTPRSQLPVEPLLCGVKLGAVAHLAGEKKPLSWVTEGRLMVLDSAFLRGLPAGTRSS